MYEFLNCDGVKSNMVGVTIHSMSKMKRPGLPACSGPCLRARCEPSNNTLTTLSLSILFTLLPLTAAAPVPLLALAPGLDL